MESIAKRGKQALGWLAEASAGMKVLVLASMVGLATLGCTATNGEQGQGTETVVEEVTVEETVVEEVTVPVEETVVEEVTVEETVEVATESEEQAESSAEPEGVEEARGCVVGEACELDTSTITVTDAQRTQIINAIGETFEGDFVIVEFDYTYGGDSPIEISEPPFEVDDESNRTYSLYFDATSSYGIENDRSLIYETVQPGVTTGGSAIFEVSPDAQGLTLVINRDTGGNIVEIPLGV